MQDTALVALMIVVLICVSLLSGCPIMQKPEQTDVAPRPHENTQPSPASSDAAPADVPREAGDDETFTAEDMQAISGTHATVVDWIGKPLTEYLATIDYPETYELRSIPAGQEVEKPGKTLFKLEGREAKKVKVIDEGRWMLIDTEEKAMYGHRDEWETIRRLQLTDVEGFTDPNGAADMDSDILGEEVVDTHDCWVIETSSVGLENEVWVDKSSGLVRQVKRLGRVHRYNYYRVNEIPDSEFELPEGMEVVERGIFVKH
jgi:hypothetical protein